MFKFNKYLLFIFIINGGCASGEMTYPPDNNNNNNNNQINKLDTPLPSASTDRIKECVIDKKINIRDCSIYFLKCEDNSEEIISSCSMKPVGIVINPPRPI